MKIELTADIIYPIVYTLFYGLLLSWLFQRAFKWGFFLITIGLVLIGLVRAAMNRFRKQNQVAGV